MTEFKVWMVDFPMTGIVHASRECPSIVNIGDDRILEMMWWDVNDVCKRCGHVLTPVYKKITAELRQTIGSRLRELELELQQ